MGQDDPALNLKVQVQGAQQASQDLNGVADATKQVDNSTKSLSEGAGEARSSLREFSRSGAETREVIDGLDRASKGGAGAIVGMAQAVRGFIGVARGAVAATGAGGLILVLGAIIGLFASFRKSTDDAGEGLKKNADATEELKKRTEALGEAAKKQADEQIKDLKLVNEQFGILISSIDATLQHTLALNSAQEKLAQAQLELGRQKALSGATTDEQREKINTSFDLQKEQLTASTETRDAQIKQAAENLKILQLKEEQSVQEKAISDSLTIIEQADEKRKQAILDSQEATKNAIEAEKRAPGSVEAQVREAEQRKLLQAAKDASSSEDEVKKQQQRKIDTARDASDKIDTEISAAKTEHDIAGINIQEIEVARETSGIKTGNTAREEAQKVADEKAKKAAEAAQKEREKADRQAKLNAQEKIKSDEAAAKSAAERDQQLRSLDLDQPVAAADHGGDVAGAVDGLKSKVPKPLDSVKIVNSVKGYHEKVVQMQDGNQQALNGLVQVQVAQSGEIDQLKNDISQLIQQINLLAQQQKNSRS